MSRGPLSAAGLSLLAWTLCGRAAAAADPRHDYAIAIGYNGVLSGDPADLRPLRFADDDAIAFAEFAAETVHEVHLLTVPDADTRRRLGDSLPATRPPTLGELRVAVADVRQAIDEDASTQTKSVVYVYYSGHGSSGDSEREAALALADGALTRSVLYDEVLAMLSGASVHLFVDACHAEAVVRARDAEAQVVPTTDEDRRGYALTQTLSRFPNVGAVLATASSAQAHEWEAYLGGVFTHELLSGLRGAADVNGDGRIEYSELAAFLAAANGAVRDPRARLEPLVQAPVYDPRQPIVDRLRRANVAVLDVRGIDGSALFVEDDRGDRLADVRPESGYGLRLSLPANRTWYVHTVRGEAEVRPASGQLVSLERLAFHAQRSDGRGRLESALHEGLFARPFGWAYYRGFVDAVPGMTAVPWSSTPWNSRVEPGERRDPLRAWIWASAGASAALAAGAITFGVLALRDKHDYDASPYEVPSSAAASRYARDTGVAYALGSGAVLGAVAAVVLFLHSGHDGPTTASAGARGLTIEF